MFEAEFEILPALRNHPRADLGLTRTPITPLRGLSRELGLQLFAKRDDLTGLAMGGNKVRQLEYYLGPGEENGADTVLITGAVQSNFVRLCAAAARVLGWHPIVQLEDRVPSTEEAYNNSGNVLLDRLMGADIHYFPEGENEAAADANLDRLADELKQQGRRPHVIHLGTDHPPVGGLGYALCAAETFLQCQHNNQFPDAIVIPTGSGITHSGFLAGALAIGWDVPIHGICVRRDASLQQPRIEKRTLEVLELLGLEDKYDQSRVVVHDDVLAPGYGRLNDAVIEAMQMSASKDAIILDPVYTGRAMAGLIDLSRRGVIASDSSTLFLHTGGLPGLFAYEEKLRPHLPG